MKDVQLFIDNGERRQFAGSARRSSLGNIRVYCEDKEIKPAAKPVAVSARRRSVQIMPFNQSGLKRMDETEECVIPRDSNRVVSDKTTIEEGEEFCAVPYDDSNLEHPAEYEEYVEESQVDDIQGDDNDIEADAMEEMSLSDIEHSVHDNVQTKPPVIDHTSFTLEKIEEEPVGTEEESILERIDQLDSDDETVIFQKSGNLQEEEDTNSNPGPVQTSKGDVDEDYITAIKTKPAKTLKQTKWMKIRQKFGKFVTKSSDSDYKQAKGNSTIPVITSSPTEKDLFKPKVSEAKDTAMSQRRGRSQSLMDFRKSSTHQLSKADLAHLQKLNEKATKRKSVSASQKKDSETVTTSVQIREGKLQPLSGNTTNNHAASRLRNRRVSLDVNYLTKASTGVSKEELLGIKRPTSTTSKEDIFTIFEEGMDDSDGSDELNDNEFDFYRILEDPDLFKLYVKH